MRSYVFVVAGAFTFGACAKTASVGVAAPTQSPSASTASATAVATPAPSSQQVVTHVVSEVVNSEGYRFTPDTLTVKEGDLVRFVMVSGGPHNVVFDQTNLSGPARAALAAGMPDQVSELSGKFLLEPGETYTVSFRNVPPGKYPYLCLPHAVMDQRGAITVVSR